MWLLDVLENQTSSQKREDLSSLRISKKKKIVVQAVKAVPEESF